MKFSFNGVLQIAQSSYSAAGSRPYGGASRGHFGPRSHGSGPFRGRGRGRGRNAATNSVASVAGAEGDAYASGYKQPTFPAPVWPPASMAWCELCRVDCNTSEILEQHKNGKKHKKNLKLQEELQKQVRVPNEQMHNSELKPQASYQTGKVEASEEKKLPEESLSTHSVSNENKVELELEKESVETEQTEETRRKLRMDNFGAQRHGFKRKMRGGRGGKWMRTHEGSRRSVEPPKPKEIIPLICELCNAKCESPIVFDSHLKGKKHLANLKRFQGQQEAALQALYPAIQALYPTLQALCQLNSNASTSFAPQFLQQGFNGSQNFIEPGSSVFSHGQSSASGPPANAASAPPSILETNDQQTSILQGSTSVLTESQNEPLQFERKEADVAGDRSVVALQNTLAGADQFPLGTKTGEAVGVPNSETAPSDHVSLPGTESQMD